MQQVERAFNGAGITLVSPGRILLGEGRLQKSCRKGLEPRHVFLFSDILVRSSFFYIYMTVLCPL